MAASKLTKFMPSNKFLSSLKSSTDGEQKVKLVNRILKELELVDYFHTKVPEFLNDYHWEKLVRSRHVADRVSMIEYFALSQRREKNDKERREARLKAFNEQMEREKAKYENGQMGYGPYLYQLMLNPMRNMKHINLVNGSRQYYTRMLAETPKVAFDLQFLQHMPVSDASKIGAQVEMCLAENTNNFRRPFHLEFLNLNLSDQTFNLKAPLAAVTKHLIKEHADQQIVPDFYPDMHYKFNDKNVYYVTKFAKRFFEGPLDPSKTIILPATMDKENIIQSINVVKKYRFTPIYLPIRKYIKWESGGFYMPLPNILRTLKIVAETGGDWETAINQNVAYRHTIPIQQQREKIKHIYDEKQQLRREKTELIKMIENTVKD
uniref:SAM-dependent MTase TRM10-type domain-containing protein n=2 Tax=Panagrolaimus superbus TaxID=310955 RepID=A0A914YY55_9BILA